MSTAASTDSRTSKPASPIAREVVMPKATRAAGPATGSTTDQFEDDTPTRAELIEALGNLRADSDIAYAEWQRTKALGFKEAAHRAKTRWDSLHRHMDNMLDGIELMDAITADLANYDTP